MIDGHLHIDLMSYGDIDDMLRAGIEAAVTCAYVQGATSSNTILDHFRLLLDTYLPLVHDRGFGLGVAVGIHPRGIPLDWTQVLDTLPEWLVRPGVLALGEVGLEIGDSKELLVLEGQFKVAAALNKPVIVHLPGKGRREMCRKVLSLIEKTRLDPETVVIDHVGPDVIDMIASFGCRPGLTIKPGRLSPDDLLRMLKSDLGITAKGILNSDSSNLKASDPLAVAETGETLFNRGVDNLTIAALTGGNAEDFFRFS